MAKKIAVDFDGTISGYVGWKGIGVYGDPIPGAGQALKKLKEEGYEIIIFTSRLGEVSSISEYLNKHNIVFDLINEQSNDVPENLKPTCHCEKHKLIAEFYIDDRAIEFKGDWSVMLHKILSRPLKKEQIFSPEFLESIKDSEHLCEFFDIMAKGIGTKLDGNRRYGEGSWNSLGVKGIFCDLNRKYRRLKTFIWEGSVDATSESLFDTCEDMMVYAVHMMMSLKRKQPQE